MGIRNIFRTIIILFCAFLLLSCTGEKAKEVSLAEGKIEEGAKPEKDSFKFAIAAMISPKETFKYYKEMLDYVAKEIGTPAKLIQRENYAEVNNLVKDGLIDAAFVCSGAYVDGYTEFGMELLVAPRAYGEPYYYSYIIVHKDSDIRDFEGLKGKKFAFTDPMSNTGKLVPTYMLAKMGETPDDYFSKYIFTYSHDKSIEAVAQKIAAGAAVDSLIWDYANAKNPEFTSMTKIINKSPPYGIPPIVVPKELDIDTKIRLKGIFLNMHKNEECKKLLDTLNIDRFVEIENDAYDSIREMKRWVEGLGEQKK